MNIPSFKDWAVMYNKAFSEYVESFFVGNPMIRLRRDGARWLGISNYILSRIERKERAWKNQIEMTMPTFHNLTVENFSDDGFPYPKEEGR